MWLELYPVEEISEKDENCTKFNFQDKLKPQNGIIRQSPTQQLSPLIRQLINQTDLDQERKKQQPPGRLTYFLVAAAARM